MGQMIGFWVLCAYMVSAILNEWAFRIAGTRGYLSIVALLLLPFAFVLSGAVFTAFKSKIGWWWAGFGLWLLVATPFSLWRGGSIQLLMNYLPRSYMLFFFVAALAYSLRNCRQLMYVNILVSLMSLATVVAFGRYSEDGRYFVPGGAGFFENSNELAVQLLLGITQFVYLFSQKNKIGKLIAAGGIACSVPYILRTGSRGCMLAAIAYGVLLLYLSRNRVRVIAVGSALAIVAVALAPSSALNRLMLLTGDEPPASLAELSAIESQTSRIALLKKSVVETMKHPLFGVGPGQFPLAVMDEAKGKGEWFQWLGTHNSYTQISSETGVPGFICYFAVLLAAIKMNLDLFRRSRSRRGAEDINALSIALLSACVVYAVASFFFHMAFTGTLPYYAGETLALQFAVDKSLAGARA